MNYINELAKVTNSLNVRGTVVGPDKKEIEKEILRLDLCLKNKEISMEEYQQKKSMLMRKLTPPV